MGNGVNKVLVRWFWDDFVRDQELLKVLVEDWSGLVADKGIPCIDGLVECGIVETELVLVGQASFLRLLLIHGCCGLSRFTTSPGRCN